MAFIARRVVVMGLSRARWRGVAGVAGVAGVGDEGEPARDVLIIRGVKRVDTHR
jgi:hypothetical protein